MLEEPRVAFCAAIAIPCIQVHLLKEQRGSFEDDFSQTGPLIFSVGLEITLEKSIEAIFIKE